MSVLTDEMRSVAEQIVAKYPNRRSAALPLLFLVQSVEGHVTDSGMRDVADILGLTPAEVLATGSFYTMLKKKPQGEYLISVCRNISCTHLGAHKVFDAAREKLGIEPGGTTPDGRFSLEAAECLATCDGAPSMQINYEDFYKVTPSEVVEIIDSLAAGKDVKSVAGETVRPAKDIAFETATAGLDLPHETADTRERLVGGESPPSDMAPGHRPVVPGIDAPPAEGGGS
ncbi:MAG: NADH-quinone oxidoreductase subunit NuoE [Actinobacteria bacterium]|nr:NADH-quinone oxidoreductase subunit NuoE [Actinomycetota bacterium]